jgi:hypothetical protein
MSLIPAISAPVPPLYFVEADFGRHGRAFVETDRDRNSRAQVIEDIADCQIENPIKVLEIFEDEGTARDVTEDIALAVREFLHVNERPTPLGLVDWIDHHCGKQLEAAE